MNSSLVGRTLGKYEIIELLGQGGMATVYKGYQQDVERYVAIKVLPPHPGQDEKFVERFRLEARTVARLQHPHILPLYEYGTEDDILYLVMAYVEGGSLDDLIDEGPLPVNKVEQILRQVGSALDYAHRRGVIHRDVKPANILLDTEGHALLADFGIVKISEGGSGLTATGGLVGTPTYMAPEQGQGRDVTPAADIYALGIVVYEMITGQQPFSAETPMQVLISHMTEPIPPISSITKDLPQGMEEVMALALAKDPALRYQSATEFANDFGRVVHRTISFVELQNKASTLLLDQTPTPGASGSPAGTTIVTQPQNTALLLGGFGVIAVLIVVVLVVFLSSVSPGARTESATPTDVQATATTETVAVVPTTPPIPTFGRVSFTSVNGLGDTLTLQTANMDPPVAGTTYAVWLQNTLTGAMEAVGPLTIDPVGSGVLSFTHPDGLMLSTEFNAIMVTQEESVGDEPAGAVVYSGSVPIDVTQALQEIFVESPDGIHEIPPTPTEMGDEYDAPPTLEPSLLAGALAEGFIGEQHAGLAARADNVGGLHTHAEHTINILLGSETDLNGDGRASNPGRGFGVPHFLDLIEARLDAATQAESASRRLQADAELIRVCLDNVRGWVDEVVALENEIGTSASVEAVATQAAQASELMEFVMHGTDLNQNGQVEAFEGECGLQQIGTFGVLVGGIDLLEGPLAT